MLFHTWHFLFFFLVVYSVYLPLRKSRFYLHWLLAASYVFYAWWNPLYLILILVCTAINYFAVLMMDRSRKRKSWLVVSVANSLLLLGVFKYADFATANLNVLFSGVDIVFEPG